MASCLRSWPSPMRLQDCWLSTIGARKGFAILKLLSNPFTTDACIQFLVKPGRTIANSLASTQDCLTTTTLRSSALACPRVLLEKFCKDTAANGFASARGRRRYFDGLRSSNLEKRNRARHSAVKWLVQW